MSSVPPKVQLKSIAISVLHLKIWGSLLRKQHDVVESLEAVKSILGLNFPTPLVLVS